MLANSLQNGCRIFTPCLNISKKSVFQWTSSLSLYPSDVNSNVCRHYSTPSESKRQMTFEEYKKLKKRLKWTARVAGIPGFAVFSGISAAINVHYHPDIMNLEAAEVQPILGMDPIVFASLCGFGAGTVGFFVGASLFNTMWRVMFRKKYGLLKERDEDFLQRIQKFRFSEFSRYEDDYYGDKIMTLSDYRQWIRQQQRRRESAEKFAREGKSEK